MKATSEDHYRLACETLKEKGITNIVHHFSPYQDGYDKGGPHHVFWDRNLNQHEFIFNSKNEIIAYRQHPGPTLS